jgi:integrase
VKLRDYTEKWLDQIAIFSKPSTQASTRSYVQKMDKFFGETDIETISEDLAQQYISFLFKEMSPRAVRTYWGTLKRILERAKKENLIKSVPEPILPKGGAKPQLYFNTEQLKSLARRELLWWVFAETGARAGEVFGLKNSDIDFKNQTLTVNRSVYAAKEQNPKTSNAFRTISLSSKLCNLLKKSDMNSEFLFSTRNNTTQYQTNVLRKLHKDLQELQIGLTGFHAFRRGNATTLADLGTPIKVISVRHGRSTGNITVDSYICYTKLDDKKYAESLGEILSR